MVLTRVIGQISWLFDGIIQLWPALLLVASAFALQGWFKNRKMDVWLLEHYQRISGILIFAGYFFWLKVRQSHEISSLINQQFPWLLKDVISILIGGFILGLAIFKMGNKASESRPQVKYSKLTNVRLISFVLCWVLYLAFYEFYFRGVLLFMAFKEAPVIGVVDFNLIIYAGVHIVKSFQQVLLAFPFGLLLVGMTYYTGHIWFALVIHLVLALGFEVSALISQRKTTV